jgi:ATP-dependent Clp protease ATP-binding subunit ClpA
MNRIDRVVAFQPLGGRELHRILDIELRQVEDRLVRATGFESLTFNVSSAAREFLLRDGTDARYGARHLKRAIERHLVQPISNLVATDQVVAGDRLFVDCGTDGLVFSREGAENSEIAVAAA